MYIHTWNLYLSLPWRAFKSYVNLRDVIREVICRMLFIRVRTIIYIVCNTFCWPPLILRVVLTNLIHILIKTRMIVLFKYILPRQSQVMTYLHLFPGTEFCFRQQITLRHSIETTVIMTYYYVLVLTSLPYIGMQDVKDPLPIL